MPHYISVRNQQGRVILDSQSQGTPMQIVAADEITIKTGKASFAAPTSYGVAVGDVSGDQNPDIVTGFRAPGSNRKTIELLLPAVQKVREAASRHMDAAAGTTGGYGPKVITKVWGDPHESRSHRLNPALSQPNQCAVPSAPYAGPDSGIAARVAGLPYIEQENIFNGIVRRGAAGAVALTFDARARFADESDPNALYEILLRSTAGAVRASLEHAIIRFGDGVHGQRPLIAIGFSTSRLL